MKALKLPLIWVFVLPVFVMLAISCKPPATVLHHSGSFSNIRSEIRLTDGSVLRGYSSINSSKDIKALKLLVPGEKAERIIPLSKIDRLWAEDFVFVVKWLQTPNRATREGKPTKIRAMVKRVSIEEDLVQVFEYKYGVSNPKSPIYNTMTAWFVSFPGEPEDSPLCELNSHHYKQKWLRLLAGRNKNLFVSNKVPTSVKSLLDQVNKLTKIQEQGGLHSYGAAE